MRMIRARRNAPSEGAEAIAIEGRRSVRKSSLMSTVRVLSKVAIQRGGGRARFAKIHPQRHSLWRQRKANQDSP